MPIRPVVLYISLKYKDDSLRLCIIIRKRIIRYLRWKYDGGTRNRRRSSCAAVWNEPLHNHGWCSVDDASAVVLMEKRWQRQPPPLEQCSWLNPWCLKTPWWFDPPFYLNWVKTLCVCQESANEMVWEWGDLKPGGQNLIFILFFRALTIKMTSFWV
jgi:hypothetical protein